MTEQKYATDLLSAIKLGLSEFPAMEIGDLIRRKRKERRLSQRALAELLNVSRGAVAQWELGETTPTNLNMAALKTVLGIGQTIQGAADAPYQGQLVDDPDELAWLRFWQSMSDDRRTAVTELLHIGLPSRKAQ